MKEKVLEELKRDEGLVLHPYKDKFGYLTIGYGTKIEEISKEEAEWLLNHRLTILIENLIARKPIVTTLPEPIQEVLYNMVYNLGVGGLLGFKRMWRAIEQGNYNLMAKEMKSSKWYKQVGARAVRLVKKVKDYAKGE